MILLYVTLGLVVLMNVPIAIALGLVAVIGMFISGGTDTLFNVALVLFDAATNFSLLAIPLFILAGALMNTLGISQRLIDLHFCDPAPCDPTPFQSHSGCETKRHRHDHQYYSACSTRWSTQRFVYSRR